jgi:hypothetical protein
MARHPTPVAPSTGHHEWAVLTHHPDGALCFHTAPTKTDVEDYARAHITGTDTVEYYALDPYVFIDGVHWRRTA